jgi:hypothetical protein
MFLYLSWFVAHIAGVEPEGDDLMWLSLVRREVGRQARAPKVGDA